MKYLIPIRFKLLLAAGLGAAAMFSPRPASADMVGPYPQDANTLVLLHFDEASGGSVTANVGTLGGNFYSVNFSSAGANPPVVTTMLGATGYLSGPTNFHKCENNTTAGYLWGYDRNNDGAFEADNGGSGASADAIAMSLLNIGNGGQSPFTLEALIQPTTTAGNQEIICTDSGQASRGFQFRITSGSLQFQFITGGQAVAAVIPTSGPDGFVAGAWYHAAVVYDGAKGTLYWTKLDSTQGAAHVLGTPASLTLGTAAGAVTGPLVIGNRGRPTGTETFLGSIDEVRISKVARSANQMQFFSPLVTITQNPISQNVDYNQPVTFTVAASSQTPLGYQWRFNSNSIAGITNTSYVITNVAASHAGYYDVIVTNPLGYAATSTVAQLVVGAANFLGHRYSFTTDASDSIGGANGTLYGNAVVANGALVLDGTADTYAELPAHLFTGANATALTVEFWATYGANANNSYVFCLGNTNAIIGGNYGGLTYVCFSPHNGSGHQVIMSPGDNSFNQVVTGAGVLDGLSLHIACVMDPPNKTLTIYTNGVLEAVNTNLTVNISSLNDAVSWIGRSLFQVDPYCAVNIDELRMFNGALSGISVRQSHDQGPNTILADGPAKFVTQPVSTSVPVGQTATFTAATVGYLPITYQWFKNGILVSNANSATFSFTTTLADDNATIVCYATNTIGVTTYVVNSSTVSLNVFTPPTLAWLDGAHGAADNSWNTTSLDWTNDVSGGGVIAFTQTNGVVFDARGSGSPTVDLTESITPYKITVDAAADYILTSSGNNGALVGQGSITKLNSGKLTIDLTNILTGAITVSGGTLQVGNGDSLGSLGGAVVTNNATLSFNRGDAVLNVGNSIHGSGTVSYDGGGTVTISGASDYTGNTLINQGILNLQSGSGLGASSVGTTVANGGQLYVTANVDLAEPLILNGAGDGNGALRKGGAGLTACYGAVALASDSTIGLDGGATLTMSNVITGAAALTVNGSGTLALDTVNTYNGGTTLSGAIINLGVNGALGTGPVTVNGAGRMLLADGLNLTNAISASTVSPGVLTGLLMVNDNTNGTVTTVSGPIAFSASAANGGHFVGPTSSGYLNVSGVITMPDGFPMSVRVGDVRFSGVGSSYTELQVRANTTSLGANNGLATNAVLDLGGNGSTTIPTALDLNGFSQTLAGLKNTVTTGNVEWVTNSGATAATLTLNVDPAGAFDFGGSIVGNLGLTLNSGSQTLDNGGAALDGLYTYTGNTVINGGTLTLAAGINLSNTPTIFVGAGATLDASAGGLTLGGSQTLAGNGLVNGNVTGGGVAPGASIGVLTINGDEALAGHTAMELNKALHTNDQLVVSGTLTYGGTLAVTNLGGTLATNDSFQLFSAAAYAGAFSSIVPATPGPGLAWNTNSLITNGVLSIIAGSLVANNPTNITAVFSGSTLTMTWPGDHLNWILQVQTNNANVGLYTNWVDLGDTAAVTQKVVTISATNGAVFYRLRHP